MIVSEKQRYLRRIENINSAGLRDVHFYSANVFNVSEEDAYGELNRLHDATDLPDREVLGKYSPKL